MLLRSHTPIFMELAQFSSPVVYFDMPNEDDPLPAKRGLFVELQLHSLCLLHSIKKHMELLGIFGVSSVRMELEKLDRARRTLWMLALQAFNFTRSQQISSNMDGAMKF